MIDALAMHAGERADALRRVQIIREAGPVGAIAAAIAAMTGG